MSPPFTVSSTSLDQVDGSARLNAGNTSVISSVTGPIEAKLRQELPTQASLEIIVRPSKGVSSTREKVMEDFLRSILQSVIVRFNYPRQSIQIVVQFLTSDSDSDVEGSTNSGSHYNCNEMSAAINCVYFALINAKVALYESFASVSMAVSDSGVIDTFPSSKALKSSKSHHVVAFGIRDAKASKILLVDGHGSFSDEQLVEVIEKASKVCERIHSRVQRPAIENEVARDFAWQN